MIRTTTIAALMSVTAFSQATPVSAAKDRSAARTQPAARSLPAARALPAAEGQTAGKARAPESIEAVFRALRGMTGFEAAFHEEKHLTLLKAPLKSSGKLYYLSPGHLVRRVEKPEKMTIVVSKGVVTIKDAEGTRKMDLSSRPGVAAFVESFAHFLDGNRVGLEKHFRLEYRVDPADPQVWHIELLPRAAPLDKVIKKITMRGQGTTVRSLVVAETNGDESVTRLSAVDNQRTFSTQEKKHIFGM